MGDRTIKKTRMFRHAYNVGMWLARSLMHRQIKTTTTASKIDLYSIWIFVAKISPVDVVWQPWDMNRPVSSKGSRNEMALARWATCCRLRRSTSASSPEAIFGSGHCSSSRVGKPTRLCRFELIEFIRPIGEAWSIELSMKSSYMPTVDPPPLPLGSSLPIW